MPARPSTIYRVIDNPTTFTYYAVLPDGSVSDMGPTLKRARLVFDLIDNIPCLPIQRAAWEALIEQEKVYIVCRQCGEAFDDMTVAYQVHQPGQCGSDQGWDLLPESEAM